MEIGKQQIEMAAAWLDQELAESHNATMTVFNFAASINDYPVQLEAMKIATRMMQAQAAAALALQRLNSDYGHHTYTVRHEGGSSEKSKTNVPAGNGQATDAETVFRA